MFRRKYLILNCFLTIVNKEKIVPFLYSLSFALRYLRRKKKYSIKTHSICLLLSSYKVL